MSDLDSRLKQALHEISRAAPDGAQPRVARAPALRRAPLVASLAILATAVAVPVGLSQLRSDSSQESSLGRQAASATAGSHASRDEVTEVEQQAMRALKNDPGFGKVAVDYDEGSVVIAWGGDVPSAVRDFVESDHGPVRVRLTQVEYSQRELVEAIDRVSAARIDLGLPEGTVYLPSDDLSGIVVETLQGWDGDAADVARVAGVPAHVVIVSDPPQLLGG
jgi:hypothetical protein